jgi:hypothetical protein
MLREAVLPLLQYLLYPLLVLLLACAFDPADEASSV